MGTDLAIPEGVYGSLNGYWKKDVGGELVMGHRSGFGRIIGFLIRMALRFGPAQIFFLHILLYNL